MEREKRAKKRKQSARSKRSFLSPIVRPMASLHSFSDDTPAQVTRGKRKRAMELIVVAGTLLVRQVSCHASYNKFHAKRRSGMKLVWQEACQARIYYPYGQAWHDSCRTESVPRAGLHAKLKKLYFSTKNGLWPSICADGSCRRHAVLRSGGWVSPWRLRSGLRGRGAQKGRCCGVRQLITIRKEVNYY